MTKSVGFGVDALVDWRQVCLLSSDPKAIAQELHRSVQREVKPASRMQQSGSVLSCRNLPHQVYLLVLCLLSCTYVFRTLQRPCIKPINLS